MPGTRLRQLLALTWCVAAAVLGEEPAGEPTPVPALPETVAEGAKLELVYEQERVFFEGPTWDPASKKLYFTAFPKKQPSQILRLDAPGKVHVWMPHGGGINGMWLAHDGRLLGTKEDIRAIVSQRIGAEGPEDETIVYQNKELNQTNDVVQLANGNIYFTDPDFKTHKSGVYLIKPDGSAQKVVSDLPAPNGVIASLDGKTLYLGDSHRKHWLSYPIQEDGTLGKGKVFFEPQTADERSPDGMSIDAHGNLYFSGRGGVWVVSPAGKALGLIAVKEFCSNCAFGGEDGKTLYLTCSQKVYALKMTVRGGMFNP